MQNINRIAYADDSFGEHPDEDAFLRHYAVANGVINGAGRQTCFADLRDFQKNIISNFDLCSQGQRKELNAFRRQVFGKIPVIDI